VISGWLCNYDRPLAKVTRQKNAIPAVKKERFDYYTRIFGGGWLLISSRNPLSQQKNAPNTGEAGLLQDRRNATENGREMDALVTTRQLFWPNERRERAFLLPIRLPNPSFPGPKYKQKADRPPGGAVSRVYPLRRPRTEKLIRNFCPNERISHLA
jgi:hypothetical protein